MLSWVPGPADPPGKRFHAAQKEATEQGDAAWMHSLHELSFRQTGLWVVLGMPERGR